MIRDLFPAILAMGIAAWKVLPESLAVEDRAPLHLGSMIRSYWRVASHGDFILQSLGIGLGFAGFSLYISTGSDFVMHVLHLPETAFPWLFIPIIVGMSVGSALSARLAMKFPPTRLIWIAYGVMATATVANLLYANLCTPSIPWAMLPGMVYMFGLALGSPAMTLRTMDLFPEARGLAASLQGFVQMMLFALMSAIVAPFVLGDIRKLSLSMTIGWSLSVLYWWLGKRKGQVCHREVVEEWSFGELSDLPQCNNFVPEQMGSHRHHKFINHNIYLLPSRISWVKTIHSLRLHMSLIVAKAIDGHIYCLGDTKITYTCDSRSNPILNGCLKQYIFNDILLCFAGCVFSFEKDIELYRECATAEKMINIAKERAIKYEILVAAADGNCITTIKNQYVSTSTVGFVGDCSAFNTYQKNYHKPVPLKHQPGHGELQILQMAEPISDRSDYSQAYLALKSVITDSSVDSVGGAVVSISTHQGSFQYMMYCDIFTNQVIIPEPGETKIVEFGTVEGGGYALEFSNIEDENKADALPAFYFLQGGFGVVFPSERGRVSQPFFIRAENPCAWAMATKEQFNRTAISGFLSLDHCGIEGEKELGSGNFNKALDCYKLRIERAINSDFADPKIDRYLSGYYVSLYNSGFRELAVSQLRELTSANNQFKICQHHLESMLKSN